MASERLVEGALLGGRYEILEIVGQGGMGTIYRARDQRLETVVAVKEMNERADTDEEQAAAVRQFEREAKLLAQLSHPNLPRVTDYFVEGSRWYLIMEFVNGVTLESLLRKAAGRPLPLMDVLHWGIQLADVLDYLHSQKPPIVFRDVKPANIMLQADNTIKLIDFGIARRFQAGATKDTLLYGSPGYSPPEQYGRAQTEPRSDIYAFGATLHHLLTGRDPSATPFKYPNLRTINASLPVALEVFVARCVEMDPDRRVQSAAEARDTLIHIRAQIAAQASAASGKAPAKTPAAPGKPAGPRITPTRPAPVDSSRRVRRVMVAAAALLALGAVLLGAIVFRSRSGATNRLSDRPGATFPNNGQARRPVTALDLAPAPPPVERSETKEATLRITSTPPGAVVIVDDRQVGVTPFEMPRIKPGKYSIRVVMPDGSGLNPWARDIEIGPGETVVLDAPLTASPLAPPATGSLPSATFTLISPQTGFVRSRLQPDLNHPGILISLGFRLTGASGKTGLIAVFFYEADQVTPLRPQPGTVGFQNADGQLSVSQSFRAGTDPAEFPYVELFVPEIALPVRYDQITYRVVLYVEGRPVAQSDTRPLLRNG